MNLITTSTARSNYISVIDRVADISSGHNIRAQAVGLSLIDQIDHGVRKLAQVLLWDGVWRQLDLLK